MANTAKLQFELEKAKLLDEINSNEYKTKHLKVNLKIIDTIKERDTFERRILYIKHYDIVDNYDFSSPRGFYDECENITYELETLIEKLRNCFALINRFNNSYSYIFG